MSNSERATTTRGARRYASEYGGKRYSLDKRQARRLRRQWAKRDTEARADDRPSPRRPQPCNPRY